MEELLQDTYNLEDERFVSLKECLKNEKTKDNLVVPLGKSDKEYHSIDFRDIPCLLVTGETGSGKSVFLDSIIVSLLIKNTPKDINFIMIDPKKIELKYYEDLIYTASNVISNKEESKDVLKYIYLTYQRRKELLKEQNIENYNKKDENTSLYHLFVIIDESSDLMKVEGSLELLKEMTDDCDKLGIHFIIATNNPYEESFDKEWINSIKYKVTFDLTSRAEASWISIRHSQNLSTPGTAIVKSVPQNIRLKVQTPYISDEDILKVVNEKRNNE